jgi:hypothetical protein
VWIDGTPVVSHTPFHEPIANGLIHLTAGPHSIRVEITPFQGTLVTVDQFAITPGLHLGWQPQENLMIEQAATAARAAEVAIVVVSAPASEGMDRSTLALPTDQDKLIAAVASANPRTVVVLNTSSAVTMPWLSQVGADFRIGYRSRLAVGGSAPHPRAEPLTTFALDSLRNLASPRRATTTLSQLPDEATISKPSRQTSAAERRRNPREVPTRERFQ